MNKFYRFVCSIAIFAIVCCCFAGCFGSSFDDIYVDGDTDTENATNANEKETTVDIPDTPTIGSTDKIVTNYKRCWMINPDGTVIVGDVVSWVMVSENLIQVTLTDTIRAGTGGQAWNNGKTCTYLLSPDRVWFNTTSGED